MKVSVEAANRRNHGRVTDSLAMGFLAREGNILCTYNKLRESWFRTGRGCQGGIVVPVAGSTVCLWETCCVAGSDIAVDGCMHLVVQ